MSDRTRQVENIAQYPRVSEKTFETSYVLNYVKAGTSEEENTANIDKIDISSVRIKQTGEDYLPGSNGMGFKVPVYEIFFTVPGREYILNERFAFLAFGSNSSPEVLAQKFGPQRFKDDPLCPVLMTRLKNHSVVESAFIGAAGSVPVTLIQTPGTDVSVSLSFYRPSQVESMTTTEPNYNTVLMNKAELVLGNKMLNCCPLVYESIWGALLNKQDQVMRNNCIPHSDNNLPTVSTLEAMRLVYDYVTQEKNLRDAWFRAVGGTSVPAFEDWVLSCQTTSADSEQEAQVKLEKRLAINTILLQHTAPKNLDATLVKPATLEEARQEIRRMAKLHPGFKLR